MKKRILLFLFIVTCSLGYGQTHKDQNRPSQKNTITEQDYLDALKKFESKELLPQKDLDKAMTTAQMYLMRAKDKTGLLDLFEKASEYAIRMDIEEGIINFKGGKAQMLISLGQPREAIRLFDSISTNLNVDKKLLGKMFKAKGDAYKDLNDLESSENNYFRGLSIAEEVRDTYNIGICYISLATLHAAIGNIYDAIDYNIKGLNILEKSDEPYLVTGACNVLSNIFYDLGNFEKAREYADKMLHLCTENGYKQFSAFANAALGKLEAHDKNFPKALEYYDLALKELNRKGVRIHGTNDKKSAFKIETSVAIIYQKLGNYTKANAILDNLKNKNLAILPLISQLNYYKTQIKSAIHINDKSSASRHLESAKKLIDENSNPEHRMVVTQLNRMVSELNGRYEEANGYMTTYYALKDSIDDKNKTQLIHNLEAKYQKAEQEKEISKLSFENEKAESKIQQKNIWLVLGGIGLAVLSFLVFQFYKLYQSNKNNKEQLAVQNGVITKALDDKNTLLKEIHHRVKNNLQVISSLLSLQSRYIKDEETLDAIKAGKSRVQSMSLLHQNLYRDDNLKGVEMNQYFQNLGHNLFDTYNIEENIRFTTDIDDITLDIDTVVPMGLITNELISNALKHAFKGRDSGKIHLSLKEKENTLFLTVHDDGVGLPDAELPVSYKSLGATLIQSFAEKLEGEIKIDVSNGSKVTIKISDYNKIK